MIKEIIYNPYRILGVYANSSKKEQIANKGKLLAFLKVKKSMIFPLDLDAFLPPIVRTEEIVNKAIANLTLEEDQVKYAQFWFIKKTPIDEVAFNHLIAGDIIEARKIWSKVINMSSLQNLFILELICNDYTESEISRHLKFSLADSYREERKKLILEHERRGVYGTFENAIAKYAVPLYDKFLDDFFCEISANHKYAKSFLIKNIVEISGNKLFWIGDKIITDGEWKNCINTSKLDHFVQQIEDSLVKAKTILDKKNPTTALSEGNSLIQISERRLNFVKSVIKENSTQYQIIADKVAMTVIDCMVAYYNATSDADAPVKALPLCDFACKIAEGLVAKKRAEDNRNTIVQALDNMPPQSILEYAHSIDDLFAWYAKQDHTSEIAFEFIQKVEPLVVCIKAILGKEHDYYLRISSEIVGLALNNVIDDVNKTTSSASSFNLFAKLVYMSEFEIQERKKDLILETKKVLKNAWQVILYLDLFDKSEEFKKDRYNTNRDTLKSLINNVKGFDKPVENYYSTIGCCYGITADAGFLTTEEELFQKCDSLAYCESYVARYPDGNHIAEIEEKIEYLRKRNRNQRFAILISLIVLFFSILAMYIFGNFNHHPAKQDNNLAIDSTEVVSKDESTAIDQSNEKSIQQVNKLEHNAFERVSSSAEQNNKKKPVSQKSVVPKKQKDDSEIKPQQEDFGNYDN